MNQTVNEQRVGAALSVSFTAAGTTSTAVDISHAIDGLLEVTAEFGTDVLSFLCSATENGTYRAIEDAAGDAVSVTVASGTYVEIPAAAMKAAWLKVVTNTAVDADATLNLFVK